MAGVSLANQLQNPAHAGFFALDSVYCFAIIPLRYTLKIPPIVLSLGGVFYIPKFIFKIMHKNNFFFCGFS